VGDDLGVSDKRKRAVDAQLLLQELRKDESQNFSDIMTGDESWFYYNYDSPTIFARARDKAVPRAPPTTGSKRLMVAIFFTANRLMKLASFPQRQKYNKEYFINEILEGINQECNQDTGYMVTKTMKIQIDKCRGHNPWKYCRQLAE
jgi:hypothetical protein